jgi:hypothetical protein
MTLTVRMSGERIIFRFVLLSLTADINIKFQRLGFCNILLIK